MSRQVTMVVAALAVVGVAGCADDGPDDDIPGLAPVGCVMGWQAYAVTAVDVPRRAIDAPALGLDIDEERGDSNDGIDNQIGSTIGAVYTFFPETWDPDRVADGALVSGPTRWVLEVGTCVDRDVVRVTLGRAVDPDGDGVWTITDRGVAAVGARASTATVQVRRGLGLAPVGALFAGSPTAATADWQAGLGVTAELVLGADRLDGRLGLGLALDLPTARAPVCRFLNERLAGGASTFADDTDANHDGAIDDGECAVALATLITPDLDLGACDDVTCYRPRGDDGIRDHASLGIGIHAEAVALELSGR